MAKEKYCHGKCLNLKSDVNEFGGRLCRVYGYLRQVIVNTGEGRYVVPIKPEKCKSEKLKNKSSK